MVTKKTIVAGPQTMAFETEYPVIDYVNKT